MKKRYFEIITVSLAMAILIGWFFKDALFSGTIFVERDLSRYYYPLRHFAATCVKSGIFPLWNPYIFFGNPLFATLQSSILYPPSIIYYLGDFTNTFNFFIIFHFFLAGIFTYILMRYMGYCMPASFLSAASFCFSGYLLSTVNLLTTLTVLAWLPLAMLFYYKMIKKIQAGRRAWPGSIILGIIITIMFLAGEPSVLYLMIGFFFLGSLYLTLEQAVEGLAGSGRYLNMNYLKNMSLSILIFLGLSAFQLLPFIEFLKTSSRDVITYDMARIWNLPLRDTPGMILPFFHDTFKPFSDYWTRQSWLDNYYVGILVFFLSVIAVLFDRSKKTRAIFILGIVGFAIALGKDTILFEFLYNYIPGFKTMRYTVRFFYIPTLAICILAGIGLDYYARHVKNGITFKKALYFILILSFLSSIGFYILHFNHDGCLKFVKSGAAKIVRNSNIPRFRAENILNSQLFLKFLTIDLKNAERAFFLLAIFGLLFYLGFKKEVRANIFIVPCLAFLAFTDVFTVDFANIGFNPLFDSKKFAAPTENIRYLMREADRLRRAYPLDANKYLFRICSSPKTAREHMYVPEVDFFEGLEASKDRLITDRMVDFSIYDINMYGSIYIKRNSKFLNLIMEKKSKNLDKLLELSNVRFVASSKIPQAIGFKLVNKNKYANLYETARYMPRAFLVENAVVITNEKKILEKLKEGDFRPRQEVILEEYLSLRPPQQRARQAKLKSANSVNGLVRITSYKPNEVIIETDIFERPKFLVLTDTYYPGWNVFVDGKRHKLLKADYIFRAVYLETGRHMVKFNYNPISFKIGIFISVLTALFILTIII